MYTLMYTCIGDQGIVHKIRPRNRHWGAFAKRCINNHTIRHDAKGVVPIVYCFRKMHFWGSKSHVYSIPLCFISDGALIWRRCQKCLSGLIIMGTSI